MKLLTHHLLQGFKRPDHWLYASWLDVITKYRRNALGLFWIFFPPIVYIWGLGSFFSAIGKQQAGFLAHMGFGFILFRLMSTVFMEAGGSFGAHKAYINEGAVRLSDYVLRTVSRSVIHFAFALPLLALVALTDAAPTFQGVAMSVVGWWVVVVNLIAYATLLALLGARYPDINEFFGSAFLALFLITPIVWYADSAVAGTVQGTLMRINPFYHLLEIVRAPVLGEGVALMTWVYVGIMTCVGLVAAGILYGRFARRVPSWL